MRKFLWLAAALVCAAAVQASGATPKQMSVQVRTGQLRATPSFLAKIVATADYGDRFTVLEERGTWSKVEGSDGENVGWIHTSALTKKRIKLQAGDTEAGVAASSGELALAGKGFNSQVEAEFKTRNSDIDFTWVDKMEKITISPEEMKVFLEAGGVEPREGGAK